MVVFEVISGYFDERDNMTAVSLELQGLIIVGKNIFETATYVGSSAERVESGCINGVCESYYR
jgi:hypothetical protein